MIHGNEEEAKRVCVPNLDGTKSDAKLEKEEELLPLEG